MFSVKSFLKPVLFAASLILPAHAQYGGPELRLFGAEHFSGQTASLYQSTQMMGFNQLGDSAESLRISGNGGWLVCQEAYFAGACLVARGDIDDLSSFGFSDTIASAMPLPSDVYFKHGTMYSRDPAGGYVFYAPDGYGSVMPSSSMLSSQTGYGNNSGYDSGYSNSGNNYGNNGNYGSGYPQPNDPYAQPYTGPQNPSLIVYSEEDYGGEAFGTNRNISRLGDYDFDNTIGSVEIVRGEWEFCSGWNYTGTCEILDADETRMRVHNLNNNITSIREVPRGTLARLAAEERAREEEERRLREEEERRLQAELAAAEMVIYEDSSYSGRARPVNESQSNLRPIQMNDNISSVLIRRGEWEFCADPNFSGRCVTVSADTPRMNVHNMNDNISSVRRLN
ncbi:beta/gamma crystallin-related protein [Ponticaulis sp.]|uniref:beta/gamma crystallin-related protein n=1 Tax=Ponticaulis sp. TaxID=2020902 RepID=UPI000B667EE9|nr:beta/gamma crystallin-related protein [Ponticaulis sp.]MAI90931.1 hypothetical protein [Ponticaulis sp.]OUX98274.1 MAG: hypothetical protein CBB65_10840 [Hyphomonadaceae bacterium TMED5]|tara:strand:- start:35461 stop:36648 length:1188 start_codon:yes stop_codon:yes gene_type:complete